MQSQIWTDGDRLGEKVGHAVSKQVPFQSEKPPNDSYPSDEASTHMERSAEQIRSIYLG